MGSLTKEREEELDCMAKEIPEPRNRLASTAGRLQVYDISFCGIKGCFCYFYFCQDNA